MAVEYGQYTDGETYFLGGVQNCVIDFSEWILIAILRLCFLSLVMIRTTVAQMTSKKGINGKKEVLKPIRLFKKNGNKCFVQK